MELKLFMERVEGSKNEYEVRVYKRPQDVFWMIDLKNNPHIKSIQEDDEYLSIFMDSYVNGNKLGRTLRSGFAEQVISIAFQIESHILWLSIFYNSYFPNLYIILKRVGECMKKRNSIIKTHIENNLREYAIASTIFIIGILFGVIFINNLNDTQNNEIGNYISTSIENFKRKPGHKPTAFHKRNNKRKPYICYTSMAYGVNCYRTSACVYYSGI